MLVRVKAQAAQKEDYLCYRPARSQLEFNTDGQERVKEDWRYQALFSLVARLSHRFIVLRAGILYLGELVHYQEGIP